MASRSPRRVGEHWHSCVMSIQRKCHPHLLPSSAQKSQNWTKKCCNPNKKKPFLLEKVTFLHLCPCQHTDQWSCKGGWRETTLRFAKLSPVCSNFLRLRTRDHCPHGLVVYCCQPACNGRIRPTTSKRSQVKILCSSMLSYTPCISYIPVVVCICIFIFKYKYSIYI